MPKENQNGALAPERPPTQVKEPRSYFPWVIAGVVVALIVISVILIGRRPAPPANSGGPGLAAPAAYAKNLAITGVHMSQSSSVVGFTQTYLDGDIANHGPSTLTGITVQVVFRDFTGNIAQKTTRSMELIRTHMPAVDVEPVSAAPIEPDQTREFRLIFDHVTDQWNQQVPEIHVISVQTK